jgi:hypothetical protein
VRSLGCHGDVEVEEFVDPVLVWGVAWARSSVQGAPRRAPSQSMRGGVPRRESEASGLAMRATQNRP